MSSWELGRMSSLIAVDIGNSSVRVAAVSADGVSTEPQRVWKCSSREPDFHGLSEWLPKTCCRWFICSVCRPASELLIGWLEQQRPSDSVQVLRHSDFPISHDVDRPDRVGGDRLAAAVAANSMRLPSQPAIIVDAGTATTVDVVSGSGVFLGGLIFPAGRWPSRHWR